MKAAMTTDLGMEKIFRCTCPLCMHARGEEVSNAALVQRFLELWGNTHPNDKNAVLNLNQAKALNDIIRKHFKDECHMVLAQIIHEKSLELFLENPTRCFYKYFEIEISKLREQGKENHEETNARSVPNARILA